jgi:NADH-quinone oxidoreductase subunit D
MAGLRTEEMELNMGPQHPSTHGILRVVLKVDGEIVVEAIPHIGYLHRDFEKHSESVLYIGVVPYTDRMDYVGAMNNNFGYCLTVEKLMELEVPERAEYIRVLAAELNRIASHLLAFGTYGLDIGAFTPFLYAFREREEILNLFEALCGARLTYNFIRIGGVSRDLPRGFDKKVKKFLDYFEPNIDEYNELLSFNHIFVKRTAHVGIMSKEVAIKYAITGPNLRGSGIKWDLRKNEPYSIYPKLDFDIPIGTGENGTTVGDCWSRYIVRIKEMRESVKLCRQVIDGMPKGDFVSKRVKGLIRPPKGEVYMRTETPRGELGFYLVSDGSQKPYRLKARSPCFVALSVLNEISRGCMIADLVAIIGSLDVVMGEVDR